MNFMKKLNDLIFDLEVLISVEKSNLEKNMVTMVDFVISAITIERFSITETNSDTKIYIQEKN